MTNNFDIASLIRERQDKFIETRTIIESEVNKFLESIATESEEVRQKFGYVEGASARTLLPELWNEPFRIEVYNQQLSGVLQYVQQVIAVCNEINREALECLRQ